MKLLMFGIMKIILFVILFIPMMLLFLLDVIRSWGKGRLIGDEESWSYKITRIFDK